MSYQEKRTIVSLFAVILIAAAYGMYAIGRYLTGAIGADDTQAWAIMMLVFIGAGILAAIVVQIVFHILLSAAIAAKESARGDGELDDSIAAAMAEDEMDKLIESKTSRIGAAAAGLGFLAALGTAALGLPTAVMLNCLFAAFAAGAVAEGLAQLRFYRKGVRNG